MDFLALCYRYSSDSYCKALGASGDDCIVAGSGDAVIYAPWD